MTEQQEGYHLRKLPTPMRCFQATSGLKCLSTPKTSLKSLILTKGTWPASNLTLKASLGLKCYKSTSSKLLRRMRRHKEDICLVMNCRVSLFGCFKMRRKKATWISINSVHCSTRLDSPVSTQKKQSEKNLSLNWKKKQIGTLKLIDLTLRVESSWIADYEQSNSYLTIKI